jgi:sigma-B regulation protein RsbU (phosphoserine phosphatase)
MAPEGAGSVLIVDDDEAMTELYARLLSAEGFHMRAANSGKSALELLGSFVPDLMVLDALMPEMSGLQLLEHVRGRADTRQVPVVFLTAAGDDEETITRAFALGASDYLVKPIHRRILVERVRSLVEQHRQRTLLQHAVTTMSHEHGRMRAEFERAMAVQHAQLPHTPVRAAGFRMVAVLRSCHDVGGDVFDLFEAPDGSATVVVVDVSGHGLSAAMVASAVRAQLRILLRTLEPAAALAELNTQLCASEHEHYACVALVQLKGSRVQVVNAGLPPIAVLHGDSTTLLRGGGIPPGILDCGSYDAHTLDVASVGRIVIGTDGVTEPFGGADRIDEFIRDLALDAGGEVLSAEDLNARLAARFERHRILPPDDATVLLLDRLA